MSRIQAWFKGNPERKALVSFVTAGDPTVNHTVPAMHALVAGGVDLLELGIPFSDPEAEGPAIQASSDRALANGMTLKKVLNLVSSFRERDQLTPIILMGYLNSILSMPDFARQAQAAGVDGLIMVNLPPESASELQAELAAHHIDLIYLIAPTTTDQRAQRILSQASGFVYYVSLKGITGSDNLRSDEVAARLAHLRQWSDLPICVGFGIKDAATAAAVAKTADGVVVGSALVQLLARHESDVDAGVAALLDEAKALRQGVDQG